jgi:hypothetical protein
MLETLLINLREHGIKYLLTAAFGAVAWWLGNRRARAKWRRREFSDRLNVSLNILVDGKLLIRTLMEKSCGEVFLNSAAVDAMLAASRQTTAADPILPLPKEDYWYFLNAVLNEVSEKFAEGQIRRDLGLPITRGEYVLCLTYESAGQLKTRKVRAMVIRKDALLSLPTEPPKFNSEHHITRWETLHKMKAAYAATPERFIAVEICV